MSSTHDPHEAFGKVISREHAAARASDGSAKDIRKLLQSVEEHSEEVFNDARVEGWKSGQDIGRQDFLRTTMEAVRAVHEQLFSLEPMLGPVVLQAFEKILGKIPRAEIVKAALLEALNESGAGIAVILRVAPDELEGMRSSWAQVAAERPELAETIGSIEADAGVHPGELIIENLKGRTHIGIAYQMARLRYGVLGVGE